MSAAQLVPQASTHGSFHREVAHLSAPKQCAEYVSFHGRLSRRRVGSVACAESARLLSDRYPSRPPAPMPTRASGPPRASPRGSRAAALRTLVESAYPTRLSDTGAPSGPGHIGILYFLLFQQRERGLAASPGVTVACSLGKGPHPMGRHVRTRPRRAGGRSTPPLRLRVQQELVPAAPQAHRQRFVTQRAPHGPPDTQAHPVCAVVAPRSLPPKARC